MSRKSIFLFSVLFLCVGVNADKQRNSVPLNFEDAIENIIDKLKNQYKFSQPELDFFNTISFNQEEFFFDQLDLLFRISDKAPRSISNEIYVNQPNITTECTKQFVKLFVSLKASPPQTWALSGILSF